MNIINLNKNILKLAMSPQYIAQVKDKEKLPFEEMFNDKLRLIIPLINVNIIEIVRKLKNGETHSKKQYNVDLPNQRASAMTETDHGPKLVKYRLGKIILQELGQSYLDKFSHAAKGDLEETEDNKKSIILSRSPIDIIRMSDVGGIQSCHSEGGAYFTSAIQEALDGGAVAYTVYNKDIKNVSDDDLQQEEIFEDRQRGITGIKGLNPISRMRVNRYTTDDNDDEDTEEIAMTVPKEYSTRKVAPGFKENLTYFLNENQSEWVKNTLNKLSTTKSNEIMRRFVRRGGEYSDMTDGDIFNNFFDKKDFHGNTGHFSEASQINIWDDEISAIIERFKTLKYSSIFADVHDSGGRPYISAGATVNFSYNIDKMQELLKKDLSGWKKKHAFSEELKSIIAQSDEGSYRLSDESFVYGLLDEISLSTESETNIDANIKNNTLIISISSDRDEIDDPDDVTALGRDMDYFERNQYQKYHAKLAEILWKNKYISLATYNEIQKPFAKENYVKNTLLDLQLDNISVYERGEKFYIKSQPYQISTTKLNFNGQFDKSQLSLKIKELLTRFFYNHETNEQSLTTFPVNVLDDMQKHEKDNPAPSYMNNLDIGITINNMETGAYFYVDSLIGELRYIKTITNEKLESFVKPTAGHGLK